MIWKEYWALFNFFFCVYYISIALRAHMSESTAKILEELGGYHLECRGEREVKVWSEVVYKVFNVYISNPKDGQWIIGILLGIWRVCQMICPGANSWVLPDLLPMKICLHIIYSVLDFHNQSLGKKLQEHFQNKTMQNFFPLIFMNAWYLSLNKFLVQWTIQF